jgi:uncharacterized protein with ATP-grasp and redox domains
VQQALRTVRIAGLGEDAQKQAAREAMRVLAELDHGAPAAILATRAIRAAEALYKGIDPFAKIKRETTAEALSLYESIKPGALARMADMAPVERIRYCAKLAAVGNIIDFGVSSEFDLEGTLKETLEGGLAVDESERLYNAIAAHDSILIISDNAGEIIFDRFLLDEALHMGKQAFVSVKSGPILNDATREDAEQGGITEPITIVEIGSSSLGIILDECTQDFRDLFWNAGVVVSKGQANYETLDDAPRSVFFILRAKCPIIAKPMGVSTGASVLLWHGGEPPP